MSIKLEVFRSIKWVGLGQALSQLFRIGVTLFVIRQLEQSDLGIVALAQTVTGFMEMFATMGLTASLIRKKEVTQRDIQNVFGIILLLNISIALVIFGLSGYVAQFYERPELSLVLKVFSIGFLATSLGSIPGAMMTRDMRFKALSIIQVCTAISSAITAIYCVSNDYGYWTLVFAGLAVPITSTVLKIAANPILPLPRLALKESIEHISFGGYVTAAGIIWYLYVTLDIVIAGKFWTVETVGLYAVAVQLAVLPLNRLLPVLKQVAFPAFAKTYLNDRTRLESHFLKSFSLVMVLIFPIFLGISSLAPVMVPLFLGERWTGAALVLSLLCVSAPFRFFIELFSSVMLAAGQAKVVFLNELLIMTIMMLLFFLVAMNSDSPSSLAFVWMTVYPLIALNVCRNYCRTIGISFRNTLLVLAFPFLSAAAMFLVVKAYIYFLGPWMTPIQSLISAVLLGMATYFLLIFTARRNIVSEYKDFLRSR